MPKWTAVAAMMSELSAFALRRMYRLLIASSLDAPSKGLRKGFSYPLASKNVSWILSFASPALVAAGRLRLSEIMPFIARTVLFEAFALFSSRSALVLRPAKTSISLIVAVA